MSRARTNETELVTRVRQIRFWLNSIQILNYQITQFEKLVSRVELQPAASLERWRPSRDYLSYFCERFTDIDDDAVMTFLGLLSEPNEVYAVCDHVEFLKTSRRNCFPDRLLDDYSKHIQEDATLTEEQKREYIGIITRFKTATTLVFSKECETNPFINGALKFPY